MNFTTCTAGSRRFVLTGLVALSFLGTTSAAFAAANVVMRPTLLDFAQLNVGEARELLMSPMNNGDQDSQICQQPTFNGLNPEVFSISYNSCTGRVLAAGRSCTIIARAQPMSAGLKTATINLQCSSDAAVSADLRVMAIDSSSHGSAVFSYTGANQQFVVPAGVSQLNVKMWGAGAESGSEDLGGLDCESQPGGGGGFASGTLSVSPGQTLTVRVGGRPGTFTAAGWPNGGAGHLDQVVMGRRVYIFGGFGGGGGSSSVLLNGAVAMEAGGGNGGRGCTETLAGGGIRTCATPGNQRGTDYVAAQTAGGGGYCGGNPGAAGSSFVPANGTEQAGQVQFPGGLSDADRSGAGQGADPFNGVKASHGLVKISW